MVDYAVDVDALDELRSQMQSYVAQCESALHRVEELIARVAESWDGTAAAAYQTRHRNWVQALQDMHATLDDFAEWSAEAEDAYRTVMAMNLRMAGR